MPRILLNCRNPEETQQIKSYLQSALPYELSAAATPREVELVLKDKVVHLIVMRSGFSAQEDLETVKRLRVQGYKHPALIITGQKLSEEVKALNEQNKTYFLEHPFELKILKGLIPKILLARLVPQQIHRRYRTNVETVLESFHSGEKYPSFMYNLSHGGAYFEVAAKPSVVVGDLLRFRVRQPNSKEERLINGRVVWMTHKGHVSGGYGFGIKFIKSSDIYRTIMNKM